jgi:hypothetical protein
MTYIQIIAIKSAQRAPMLNAFVRGGIDLARAAFVSGDLPELFSIAGDVDCQPRMYQRPSNYQVLVGLMGGK